MLIAELNKQKVILSAHLAKAVFRKDDHFEVVVVHKASTQNEFYWQFNAKSKRSPRKCWKFAQTFARDLSPQYYRDFDSFVAHYAQTRGAEFVSRRIQDPRRLALITSQTALTPSIDPAISMSTMWAMKDKANGIFKAKYRSSWWDQFSIDELDQRLSPPTIPSDEVHVFMDECPTCDRVHTIAHYPNGKVICADFADTEKNPALFYSQFRSGRFVFRYRNTPALPRVQANAGGES